MPTKRRSSPAAEKASPSLSFQERLLSVMDRKHHWGWAQIVGPDLTTRQLLPHFQQEYEVYVRDFPILLARVLGRLQLDSSQLKKELAENIYEEQTGGLSKQFSKNLSHPELFLKMMKGLNFSETDFKNIRLLPTSLAYRSYLDLVTLNYDARIAAALLTLFVEGSIEDRKRLDRSFKNTVKLDEKLKSHSLHRYHGLKLKDMDLVRSHYSIEGDHRKTAWKTLIDIIPIELEDAVVQVMEQALELWQLFRDGVCLEMGIEHPEFSALAKIKL